MESLKIVTAGTVRNTDVTGDRLTIGRGESNDVILEGDARASRQHAVLTRTGKSWQIADCGSTNGTYVNSVRVSGPVAVTQDDHILMGASVLSFVDSTHARGPAPRSIDLVGLGAELPVK